MPRNRIAVVATRWNWSTNDIIVLSTVVCIAVLVLWTALWYLRRLICPRSPEIPTEQNTKDNALAEEDKESTALKEYDFGRYNPDDLPSKNFHRKDGSDEKRKNSKMKIAHPKKPKKRVSIREDIDSQDNSTITESTIASTTSSITAPETYEASLSKFQMMRQSQSLQLEESVTKASNQRLVRTLVSVLGQGMTIMKYNERGAKQIHLTMVGAELRWRTLKMFAKKGKKLDLREVHAVQWGKKTPTFQTPVARSAIEEHCFSLVTSTDAINFEARNKVERDSLAQGFMTLINRYRGTDGNAADLESGASNSVHLL